MKEHRIRLTDEELSILLRAMHASMGIFVGEEEKWKAMVLARRIKKVLEGTYGKR